MGASAGHAYVPALYAETHLLWGCFGFVGDNGFKGAGEPAPTIQRLSVLVGSFSFVLPAYHAGFPLIPRVRPGPCHAMRRAMRWAAPVALPGPGAGAGTSWPDSTRSSVRLTCSSSIAKVAHSGPMALASSPSSAQAICRPAL